MELELRNERLSTLATLVDEGYEAIRPLLGEKELGYTLFLGRSYAVSPPCIMMLGLNPGVGGSVDRGAKLQADNWLMDGMPGVRLPYWRNAKRLFNQHGMANVLTHATFTFCCPFRTATWVNLPPAMRSALMSAARPALQRMITDCAPRLVIVAGIAGESVFRETMGDEFSVTATVSAGPYAQGTYRWRATQCTWRGQSFVVAQIPHLSRANSKGKLAECAEWLSGMVNAEVN